MLPRLNKQHVMNNPGWGIAPDYFLYPERILQFGTGVLLRGLVDYLVDKSNKQGIFKGRIVVVKSTDGDAGAFGSQDGLFTTHIKGVAQGELVDQYLVNASISRVLQSNAEWEAILEAATQPTLDIIVSNTTEVGIQYVEENIAAGVPASFPGKLLAILHERWSKGMKGFVIIPTELVVDNGVLLRETVLRLAAYNQLPEAFIQWIGDANRFCSSLVDRIVPGKPKNLAECWEQAGYTDELWIDAEPFLLWAIEGDAAVAQQLSFHQADERMLIAPSITPYREQKLRILNGSHTAAVCVGFLSGLNTVYECMQDPFMRRFFQTVVTEEILPTVAHLGPQTAVFAKDVLDRFANPSIEHKLISITFQQSSKMNARNVQTLLRYHAAKGTLPEMLTLGFAATLLFLRPEGQQNGKYQGRRKEGVYDITDENIAVFAEHWKGLAQPGYPEVSALVKAICKDGRLWDTDLNNIPGFADTVADHLTGMLQHGINSYINQHAKAI
ncbi:tagaturonate reductase [Chitinophaga lutea]